MTFNYSHGDAEIDSTLVYEAYYNATKKELALVFHGGLSYIYKGVPFHHYQNLVDASSPGRYYNQNIKGKYDSVYNGYVGYDSEIEFVRGFAAADMNSIVNNANTVTIIGSAGGVAGVGGSSSGVGTPKNLSYAVDAVVDDKKFDLSTPNKVTSHYTVRFTVGDDETLRANSLEATSIDEALVKTQEVAEMLDLSFNIREVTLHFE
jgi:hypothetical protein